MWADSGGRAAPHHARRITHRKWQRAHGNGALESMGKLTFGNNMYIALSPDTREEAERLFNGLSAGGKIEMPLQDMFWGSYFGSFTDKFGVQWMVDHGTELK